jgi:hypothetical protein
MPALQAAGVAVGQLVGTGVLTFRTAYETLDQSARARGYYTRHHLDATIWPALNPFWIG